MAQEDVRGGGCIARVFRRGEAGDEQQAQTAGGAASASTSYARVKGSVADRRISDFFGQARVEARRGAPGAKAGSLADHVHEGGLGLSSESSVLHGNPVSPEAGSIPLVGGAVSASQDGARLGPVQGTCFSDRPRVVGQGQAQGGAEHGLVGHKPSLEVPAVESDLEVLTGGQGTQAGAQRGNETTTGAALCSSEGAGGDAFSLHEETHGNHGVPSNLLLRPVHQGSGAASLGSHDEASRQLCSAVSGSGLQEGGASSRADGGEDSRDDRAAVRRATTTILGNASNHCYMNSWVQVMLWAIERDVEVRLPQMGRCAQFFRHLCGMRTCGQKCLTKDLMWQPLVRGWRDINRQHDVVEFASYMFTRHHVAAVQGEWEARTGIPTLGQPGDAGHSSQPLLLHLPHLPPGLVTLKVQSLVDQWHAQEAIHAFTVAPSILFIQLGRFSSEGGRVQKVHSSVTVEETIQVPVFRDAGLYVRPQPYRCVATISHHGEHPRSGHYQAVLFEGSTFWCCDDGRTAQSMPALPAWHANSCYALVYQRS